MALAHLSTACVGVGRGVERRGRRGGTRVARTRARVVPPPLPRDGRGHDLARMTTPAAPRPPAPAAPAGEAVFPGASEMAARCRAFDWAATPLGPVAGWTPSLRTAAGLVLGAGFPMILLWGPALVQLYNDAYVPFLAAKHPGGLGRPTRDVWPEVWHLNAPIYARVLGGETVTLDEAHFPVRRHGPDGPAEDLYITLAYSPVPDDAGGPHGPSVGGVLVTLRDVTAEVAGRRAESERARLAAALAAERTTLLDEVFRRAPSFLHVLRGPDFVFELANEAYYTLVGRRDLLGRPAFEALPEVAAGDFPARLAQVMATGMPFVGRELPVTLARTPGAPPEERVIDLVYLPLLDGDGACTRVLGHGVDVTDNVRARRRTEATLAERTAAVEVGLTALAASEARFRAVQETSPTGFGMQRPIYDTVDADVRAPVDGLVDAGDAVPATRRVVDFTMTYVNAAGAGMFGRAADAGVGQRLLTLFPELAALGLVEAYAGVLATGAPYQTELRHHDATGREQAVALTAVRIGAGADAEVAVSFADVTERLRGRRRAHAAPGGVRRRAGAPARAHPADAGPAGTARRARASVHPGE